jgi:hypothetical protein
VILSLAHSIFSPSDAAGALPSTAHAWERRGVGPPVACMSTAWAWERRGVGSAGCMQVSTVSMRRGVGPAGCMHVSTGENGRGAGQAACHLHVACHIALPIQLSHPLQITSARNIFYYYFLDVSFVFNWCKLIVYIFFFLYVLFGPLRNIVIWLP